MGGYELENKAERQEHVFSLIDCLIAFDLPRGLHIFATSFLLFFCLNQNKNYKAFKLSFMDIKAIYIFEPQANS